MELDSRTHGRLTPKACVQTASCHDGSAERSRKAAPSCQDRWVSSAVGLLFQMILEGTEISLLASLLSWLITVSPILLQESFVVPGDSLALLHLTPPSAFPPASFGPMGRSTQAAVISLPLSAVLMSFLPHLQTSALGPHHLSHCPSFSFSIGVYSAPAPWQS